MLYPSSASVELGNRDTGLWEALFIVMKRSCCRDFSQMAEAFSPSVAVG